MLYDCVNIYICGGNDPGHIVWDATAKWRNNRIYGGMFFVGAAAVFQYLWNDQCLYQSHLYFATVLLGINWCDRVQVIFNADFLWNSISIYHPRLHEWTFAISLWKSWLSLLVIRNETLNVSRGLYPENITMFGYNVTHNRKFRLCEAIILHTAEAETKYNSELESTKYTIHLALTEGIGWFFLLHISTVLDSKYKTNTCIVQRDMRQWAVWVF